MNKIKKNIQINNPITIRRKVKVKKKNKIEKIKDLDLHNHQNKIKSILNVAEAEAILDISTETDHDLITDLILISKDEQMIRRNSHQDLILNQNVIQNIANIIIKIKIIMIEKKNDFHNFFMM